MTDLLRAAHRESRRIDPRAVRPGKVSSLCKKGKHTTCWMAKCSCPCHGAQATAPLSPQHRGRR